MKQRLRAWGDSKIIHISALFAFNEDNELLLLQRHSDDLGGGQWGTPGGRLEAGESAEQAMRRELYEETGITDVVLAELGVHFVHMPHGTVHMTSYFAKISKGTELVLDADEHHAYGWFRTEGLLDEDNILWGVPSVMRDFGLLNFTGSDPTLADGSSVELVDSPGKLQFS